MTNEGDSAVGEKLARRVRESDALQILLEEAVLTSSEALSFDPDADETEEVSIEETNRGMTISIVDEVEVTDERIDFTGFIRNTVTGHFVADELQWVTLFHEYQRGPLSGAGTEYRYEDGEISVNHIWIS